MAILGVFDSGFGGLTVLREINRRLPSLSTVYLGDNARAPYGTRSPEEIFAFTLEGVRRLFAEGCPLVILACNTASAVALRRIQQQALPAEFPDRRVLGVIRPTVEAIAGQERVGVFATPATVASGAYPSELHRSLTQVACPGLVELIEAGQEASPEADTLVASFAENMACREPNLKSVLLGCTHYPLVEHLFRKHLPAKVGIVTQGGVAAEKLEDYLSRHPDISSRIKTDGRRTFLTTAREPRSDLASRFYGSDVAFVTA
jgi:glutamate racemase